MSLFTKPEDLGGYLFRITDNGGDTADRYLVAFSDGTYLTLSGSPTHPQGVSLWGDGLDPASLQESVENGEAVDLALGDLDAHIVQHILRRNNEAFEDLLGAIEAREPDCVASDREAAKEHKGGFNEQGNGIYWTEEGYRVRREGPPEDDLGPVSTAREALLLTLPDEHSFAGPEYHPTEDVMRMEPSPEVAARVAELEARVNSEAQPPSP